MKTLWLTRNRRGRRGAPRLSLFPFLAVLICTMGALVLLLLSVTRQARLQAAREAAANDAQRQSKIASETEMVQWRGRSAQGVAEGDRGPIGRSEA